ARAAPHAEGSHGDRRSARTVTRGAVLAQLTEPVGANVERDVRDVVQMLARDEPHDVADLTLAVVPKEPGERVRLHVLVPGEFRHVVERARSASLKSGLVRYSSSASRRA